MFFHVKRGSIAYIHRRWEPVGVLLAALLFGTADALQLRIQVLGLNIPSQLLVSLPNVVTLIASVIFMGRGGAPAAHALPWRRAAK
jgi:simple sugar transport system permease protein